MSQIRCIYLDAAPDFPATDQAPDAERFGPITLDAGLIVFVDAAGGQPTDDELRAVLAPAAPTSAEKLAAAGLTVADLKNLLGLPA